MLYVPAPTKFCELTVHEHYGNGEGLGLRSEVEDTAFTEDILTEKSQLFIIYQPKNQ